jgi:hypothetical protein
LHQRGPPGDMANQRRKHELRRGQLVLSRHATYTHGGVGGGGREIFPSRASPRYLRGGRLNSHSLQERVLFSDAPVVKVGQKYLSYSSGTK